MSIIDDFIAGNGVDNNIDNGDYNDVVNVATPVFNFELQGRLEGGNPEGCGEKEAGHKEWDTHLVMVMMLGLLGMVVRMVRMVVRVMVMLSILAMTML